MCDIYKDLDSYNDGILKWTDYIKALRTDEKVVSFIDAEAVRIPHLRKKVNID